jgi:rod shape-determining protein MreC
VYRKQVRRRRAVLVVLIVVSLVLLSSTFGAGSGGPLHTLQDGVATIFAPIEDGASRALKPARDLVNWFNETFQARGENAQLRADLQDAQRQLAKVQAARGENQQLRKLLHLDQSGPTAGYTPVTARIIGRSPTVWYSTVTIDHGTGSDVQVNDPVVTGDGLVGKVTATTHSTAEVSLITDHRSAVSAKVLPGGPEGIVEPEAGDPTDLLLDFIDTNQRVHNGATLTTAGWSNGSISSVFPPGIPIGKVTSVSQPAGEIYQRVTVRPFANLRYMDFVQVLTGGPHRPGVAR